MEFCNFCESLLILEKIENKYYLICKNKPCVDKENNKKKYITKLYIKKNIHKVSKIKYLAESAIWDDTFPSEEKKCIKCNWVKMKWFRLDSDLKKIYVCEKCHTYW